MPVISPRFESRPPEPIRVGLTGGIASGKSTVAAMFVELGVPLIDTDELAREVVEPGQPGLARVAEMFGADALTAEGRLDRRWLRERVFRDATDRRRLESILHPLILAAMNRRSEETGGPYQILAIPLLVETGLHDRVDRVLVVDCRPEVQLARLMQRDGESETRARQMLSAQSERGYRLQYADEVLRNDDDVRDLRTGVAQLDRFYRRIAAERGAASA